MKLARVVALICSLIALSCRTPHTSAPSAAAASETQGEAIIGARNARFVFPAEVSDSLTWPQPIAHAYDGFPTLAWEVSWRGSLSSARLGTDPDQLMLILRWRRESARTWSLRELLARIRPTVMTFCLSCGVPAAIPSEDRSVRVSTEGRRIVFAVEGHDAIHRLFPVVPESVTFTRRIAGEAGGRVVHTAVQHREP